MIRLIWRKELKEIFRTSKMSWLMAGVLVLMGLALYNGHAYYTTHSRLLAESQRVTYEQFISQGDKNPHLGAHFGFYAYKPTAGLAFIDNGVEDYTGTSFYLEPHKRGVVRFREVNDNTGLRSFGSFNIGFFAQFILPLFIFLICHNIFSKEWENGTIKMVLSSKATTGQVFMGKLLACLTLVGSLLLTMLLAAGSVLALLPANAQPGLIASLGWYFLGTSVFALCMTVIGVSVSLLTRHAALSLVVLSGFWLLGVFLVPRVSAEVSRRVYPDITSLEFENSTFHLKEYGRPGEGTKDERRARLADSVMRHYQVSRLEDLPVYFIPITIEYFEDSDGEIMDEAYARVADNESKQDRLVLLSSILSPFLAFRDFSMRMTATDMHTHNDFSAKAELHRRRVGVLVNDFYQQNTVAGNAFWKTVPQFSYTPPGSSWRLHNAAGAIGVLLAWVAVSVLLMLVSYRRMKV